MKKNLIIPFVRAKRIERFRVHKRRVEKYHRRINNIVRNDKRKAMVFSAHDKPRRIRMRRSADFVPANFCLSENFEEVTSSLARLRASMERHYRRHQSGRNRASLHNVDWYDFATIKRITPSSALVLTSEFDRSQKLFGRDSLELINVHKWDQDVLRSLAELGLLQMFGLVDTDFVLHRTGKTILLPIRSGDLVLGKEANGLYDAIAELIDNIELAEIDTDGNKQLRSEIYSILTEAMENVATHAYPAGVDLGFHHLPLWWMTAALNTDEKKLTVAMYDQGVSIPVSLPNWERFDRVEAMVSRFNVMRSRRASTGENMSDGTAIRVAMKVAVSSTREVNRGKGLPEMKRFIDSRRDGSLRIISRAGEYIYRKNDKPKAFNRRTSLGGTLIEWEVLL